MTHEVVKIAKQCVVVDAGEFRGEFEWGGATDLGDGPQNDDETFVELIDPVVEPMLKIPSTHGRVVPVQDPATIEKVQLMLVAQGFQ